MVVLYVYRYRDNFERQKKEILLTCRAPAISCLCHWILSLGMGIQIPMPSPKCAVINMLSTCVFIFDKLVLERLFEIVIVMEN